MPELTTPVLFAWLDELAAIWDLDNGRGGTIRSFRIFKKNELPAAITPNMGPCALSRPTSVELQYSAGGPTILLWSGQTDFHLTEDCKPANYAYLLTYFVKILLAAASNMTLNGSVATFLLTQNTPGTIDMVTWPNADGTDGHQGLIVKWQVKQNISGWLPVSQVPA